MGSFFKTTEGTAPAPYPHQQQAIASELQSYLQSGNLDSEERKPATLPTTLKT